MSQARYTSYMVRFVCYYLRAMKDEEGAVESSSRASNVALSSSESDEGEDAEDSEGSVAPRCSRYSRQT